VKDFKALLLFCKHISLPSGWKQAPNIQTTNMFSFWLAELDIWGT
jgi:hypothetical protein